MNPTEGHLVSIDPGRTVGYAVWQHATLIQAGSYDFNSLGLKTFLKYWRTAYAVIEMPDHIAVSKTDVLTCAFRAGFCAGKFEEHRMIKVGEWKGSVPKSVTKRRAERTLREDELGAVGPANHHAWDAIGLGLFALGRLKR